MPTGSGITCLLMALWGRRSSLSLQREYLAPIQWDLNAWPNVLATALALGLSGWLAVRHGHSVAETVLPARWDAVIVETLKNRFGNTHQLQPQKPGGIREPLELLLCRKLCSKKVK